MNIKTTSILHTGNINRWQDCPCPIGKYKGKTFGELVKINPGYIEWMWNKGMKHLGLQEAYEFIR